VAGARRLRYQRPDDRPCANRQGRPAPVADVSAKSRVREAFAQLVTPEPKKPEAKPQRKRKIARSRVAPPMIQVAQQPRFGFFNTW